MSQRTKIYRVLLVCGLLLGLAVPALAVDGVVEINQAKVLANGGFPFTITQSGSYRLTSNLNVTGNSHGIWVKVANVSIDLNGFTISGGGGIGVVATGGGPPNCTVSNGTVTGMTAAIALNANSRVEKVRAISNTAYGISVGDFSVVVDSTAGNNGGDGIDATTGSLISGNVVYGNAGVGMWIQYGTAIGNSVTKNASYGLTLAYGAYGSNYFYLNNGNSLQASAQVNATGSVQVAPNGCVNQPCP